MSGKRGGRGGGGCLEGATLLLAWLGALSGCGSNGANAPSSRDAGAGTASSGGAPSGGGAASTLTGGATASGGVPAAGDGGSNPGGSGGSNPGGPPDAGTGGAGGVDGGTRVSQACTKPSHVLPLNPQNPQDGITLGNFYVDTDTWNAANYQVSQTMYVCDYNDWYVVANMNDSAGDGAVKTYPNVHEDFTGAPAFSSFATISSKFAHAGPHVGIYEFAYDIWLNGIASGGSTEVMIWTDNYNQVPSGSPVDTVTFDGESYRVYKSGSYIAFVETKNVASGTLNLLSFFNYVVTKGWIPSTSTLGAVDYGVELVSTSGTETTFAVTDFSLTTQ